tara:strand:+ start:88 stop:444 length:357 start_codon:yes stop_codon:yes gene_type:complete
MPIHRSITRINNTDNKYNAINLCCCILLLYIILSIILSDQGLNGITIFCIIIGITACGSCSFFICITHTQRELDREVQEITFDEIEYGVPTVTAYPVPNNYTEQVTLEAVICQPEDSL